MSRYSRTKKFISYLESKGFTNTTKPKYIVESFDEIVTSREVKPEWYDLEKPWIRISISSDNTCYVKCIVKDTTIVPFLEKEYQGYLDSYKDNNIILKYTNEETFGAKDEIPVNIKTNSVYIVSLPE